MAKHERHHSVHKSGEHGGFHGSEEGQTPIGDGGPGYPMGKQGAQDAGHTTRGGGRASHSSHSNEGKPALGPYDTEGESNG